MTEVKEQKLRVLYEWKLAPDDRKARYFDVFVHYFYGEPMTPSPSFPVLIGATRGFETDRIYPLNHPNFSELNTRHFSYDPSISIEEYLQRTAVFAIPDPVVVAVTEYLKQHAPKE